MIGVNLTYKCNLKCYMCGQVKMDITARNQEIDFDQLCRFITQAKPFGMRFGVYLWGGEPFLYKNIFPLIRFIKTKGLFVTINTNGTLLEKYAEEIVKNGVDRLIISIDGLNAQHDEIRGVEGTFDKIIKGVTAINAIKKIRPILSSNTVITQKNYTSLYEIAMFLKSIKINAIEFQFPIFFTEEMGINYEKRMQEDFSCQAKFWKGFLGEYHSLEINRLITEIQKVREALPKHFKLVPNLKDDEIVAYFSRPDEDFVHKLCSLPWSQVRIEPNGDLVICPDFPDYKIGSIFDPEQQDGVPRYLTDAPLKQFRESLEKKGLLPICIKCCQLYQF